MLAQKEFGRGPEYFTSSADGVLQIGLAPEVCSSFVHMCPHACAGVVGDLPPTHSLITEFISHRVSNCLPSPAAVLPRGCRPLPVAISEEHNGELIFRLAPIRLVILRAHSISREMVRLQVRAESRRCAVHLGRRRR